MDLNWTRQKCLISLLALEVLLIGCSASVSVPPPAQSTEPFQVSTSTDLAKANQGQMLPISAQVKIADRMIQLEVAKTPEQQQIGLMYRTELPADRGMLFPFDPPRPVGFWMKNCLISLDMIFLRDGKVQAIAENAPPCKVEPCPVYGPSVPIDQVIELRGGRAKELGIKVGDRLQVLF